MRAAWAGPIRVRTHLLAGAGHARACLSSTQRMREPPVPAAPDGGAASVFPDQPRPLRPRRRASERGAAPADLSFVLSNRRRATRRLDAEPLHERPRRASPRLSPSGSAHCSGETTTPGLTCQAGWIRLKQPGDPCRLFQRDPYRRLVSPTRLLQAEGGPPRRRGGEAPCARAVTVPGARAAPRPHPGGTKAPP